MKKTPEDICKAVSIDLKKRGLTHAQVAEAIGKSAPVISNLLCGQAFSKNLAELFSEAFGYNELFLLYGKGPLMKPKPGEDQPKLLTDFLDPEMTGPFINILETLLYLSKNMAAINAWQSLLSGDYEGYRASLHELSLQEGNNFFSMVLFGKKVADYFRQYNINKDKEIFEAPPLE